MDSSHALVDHIATVPSDGPGYAFDATAKTGSEGNLNKYADNPDGFVRELFDSTKASPIKGARPDSAGTASRYPAATSGLIEGLELI